MPQIAILMTVHNRCEKTIQCLQHLKKQETDSSIQWHVYITDDGCTDNTVEAVKHISPETTIIRGDGSLYWNRGMYEAWKTAIKDNDYDFYLWLNDDTMLLPSAINHLMECSAKKNHRAIIAGCISSTNEPFTTTYGGRDKKGWISCNGTMQKLRLMHGNAVLIPRHVYNEIGMNDPYYQHAFGDYDYALTASTHSIETFSTANFVGKCDIENYLPHCFNRSNPLKRRLTNLYSPTSYYLPPDAFHFDLKHNGILVAIGRYVYLHLCCLFPIFWKRER
jgi:GT2 family glycosyltransferase